MAIRAAKRTNGAPMQYRGGAHRRCCYSIQEKIFRQMHFSSLGQCGRQAAERKNFFGCMGKREQRLLDLPSQRLKSRAAVWARRGRWRGAPGGSTGRTAGGGGPNGPGDSPSAVEVFQ